MAGRGSLGFNPPVLIRMRLNLDLPPPVIQSVRMSDRLSGHTGYMD